MRIEFLHEAEITGQGHAALRATVNLGFAGFPDPEAARVSSWAWIEPWGEPRRMVFSTQAEHQFRRDVTWENLLIPCHVVATVRVIEAVFEREDAYPHPREGRGYTKGFRFRIPEKSGAWFYDEVFSVEPVWVWKL